MDNLPSEENLASTSDATPKPTSSTGIGSVLNDIPSPKEAEPEVESEPVEECSVCRNEMKVATCLSDCVHEFCYECIVRWLIEGTSPFCPMCKATVRFIKIRGTYEEIPLSAVQDKKKPEVTASEDLITEKRMVSKKIRDCRRLMHRIDDIIGSSSRLDTNKREARTKELIAMKQLCVAQVNSLQLLRDDIDHGAAKALIVSRPEFRRLIYERAVMIVGSDDDDRHFVSRKEFLANIEHYRSVLTTYLQVELRSLPLSTQPKVDSQNRWYFKTVHDVLDGKDDELVEKFISLISERGVNELEVRDVLKTLNGLVTVRIAKTFLGEIKSLINSKKTFLEWCGSVLYRNQSDLGGNVAPEVVTVDDSIEVDEPSTSNRRYDTRQRRFPVFNPFTYGHPPNMNRNFQNDRRPSSSDTDQDEDIYFQAPLRIRPRSPNVFRQSLPSFHPIPANGLLWNDLMRTTDKPMGNLASTSRDVPVVDLENEEVNEIDIRSNISSDSDDNDGVQVVDSDNTIVLSDSPAIRVPAQRKRKGDNHLGDIYKRSKIEELPEGLVEDVKNLMTKYNMPMVQAMSMMVTAAQEAIQQSTATQPVNLLATSRNQNEPSTSSNLQPEDALQVAGYLARNGMASWSKNVPPTKHNWNF